MSTRCLARQGWAIVLLSIAALSSRAAAQTDHASDSSGIDLAGMDRSVKPGDDFFAYANGTWLKNTEIPPDKSAYGAGGILVDITDRRVADLIQEMAKGSAAAGSEKKMIGDYYSSFLDTPSSEAPGLKPVQPTLDSIAGIQDRKALARFLGSTMRADGDGLYPPKFYTEN